MFTVKHIQKEYKSHDGAPPVHVLTDVNCEIHEGDVISIIGPSGTGKSTFLRMLNMLEHPSGGEIWYKGESITARGYRLDLLRRKVGMVFQQFNLFPHMTVLENVIFAPVKLLDKSEDDAKEAAMALLRKVGMAEKANAYPGTLSGGQQQRVEIARCLAMEPEVILFDEPTSSLDPSMVAEVLSVMRQLASEKMTMLIVTHQMKFARDVSTRIFFMNNGVIYEEGTPDEVFGNPRHSATKEFVQGIKKLKFDVTGADFDFYDMASQMSAFCTKYGVADRMTRVAHVTEEMTQVVLASYRPLRVVLSYTEMSGDVAVAFMIKDMKKSPLLNPDIDVIAMSMVRGMSREVIEEPTKLGFRVKVIL